MKYSKIFIVQQSYGRFYQGSCELSLDPKNMKQEQAKFWKQHPAIVKVVDLLY